MGFALGALVWIMGLSWLAQAVTRKLTGNKQLGRWQLAFSYFWGWLLSIPVVAYGFADGGPVQWILGITAYLPAALVGFAATLVAIPPRAKS